MSLINLDTTYPGLLGTSYGTIPGTVTITSDTNALLFDVQLNQSVIPTFFHGGDPYSANTFGIKLDIDSYSATISNIVFDGGGIGEANYMGVVTPSGFYNYAINCANCPRYTNEMAIQSSHLTFTISAPGIGINDLTAATSSIWEIVNYPGQPFLGGVAEGGPPVPAAAVPEPATWALMLLGFVAVAFAKRLKPSFR
jgi:hypothetical protein